MRVMSSMQGSWVRMSVVVGVVVSVAVSGDEVSGDGDGGRDDGERGRDDGDGGRDDGDEVRDDGERGRDDERELEGRGRDTERTQPSPFFITTHHV